jgi:hypothetical protein
MALSQTAENIEYDLKTAYETYLSEHDCCQEYTEQVNTSTISGQSTTVSGFVEVALELSPGNYHDYLYVVIDDQNKEVQITHASLPAHLQNKGLTMGIIKETFLVASSYNYITTVGNIANPGFLNALVRRDAVKITSSLVEIIHVKKF